MSMTAQAALKQRDALVQTLKGSKEQVLKRGAWSPVMRLMQDGTPVRANYDLNDFTVDLFTRALELADVVIWEPELWQAAVVGSDNLAGVSFPAEGFVQGNQAWVSDTALVDVAEADEDAAAISEFFGVPLPIKAFTHLVLSVPGANTASSNYCSHVAFLRSGDDPLPYLRMLPSVKVGEPILTEMSAFAAAQLFMEQRFVRAETEAAPKVKNAIRRKRERNGQMIEPGIKRVTLRREAVAERPASGAEEAVEGDEAKRQYSCQWFVTGGWQRRRRGPKNEPDKQYLAPVYVDTYVKGPTHKPLKLPKATVLKVKR